MKEAILWLDTETSGPNPNTDSILEIASIISEMDGKIIKEQSFFNELFKVNNLSEIISNSEQKIQEMHDKSGLWKDLWNSDSKKYLEVDSLLLQWINSLIDEEIMLYLGGNSLTLDRQFLQMYLPQSYKRISHRSIDVTSISLMIQSNTSINGFIKGKTHRALDDVKNSIEEYKHYIKKINIFSY